MDKKKIIIPIIIGVIVIVIAIATVVTVTILKKDDKPTTTDNPPVQESKDYKYQIVYEFGGIEYDIQLLEDDTLKVISKTEEYKVCSDQNCMQPTGKTIEEEVKLDFDERATKKTVDFMTELFKGHNKTSLIASELNLDVEQKRILLSIALNCDNGINILEDMQFESKTKEYKNDSGKTFIFNTITILKSSDKNETVNKMKEHINPLIEKEHEEHNKMFEQDLEFYKTNYGEVKSPLGINITLKHAWIGEGVISLVYNVEGSAGGVMWYSETGYTYNLFTGTLVQIPNGYIDELKTKAVEQFKKDWANVEYIGDIPNREEIIKEEIVKPGNWYLEQDKIVFLIKNPEIVGIDTATSKLITIEVKNDIGEF